MGITSLGKKYGNYPRKPEGIQKDSPYVPKVNHAVIKQYYGSRYSNAPNVKHMEKKGYNI